MALIIYPAPNADSFISLTDAKTVIDSRTLDGAVWDAKSVEEQEALLRIAFHYIIDNTPELPATLPACVPEAQALMAVHDAVNGLSGGPQSTQAQVKKQKAGPVEREFFELKTQSKGVSRVPEQARSCLAAIGFVFQSFNQTRLGRS